MKIDGLKELEAALVQLGGRHALRAIDGALRDAGAVVRREMRNAAPVKSGKTRASVAVKADKTAKTAAIYVGSMGRDAWYARLVEKGTKRHDIPGKTVGRGRNKRKNGAKVAFFGNVFSKVEHPGIKPRPWAEPAFMRSYPRAIARLKQRLRERLIVEAFKKSRGVK